ncbi:cell division cycle-associated 7-like protein [Senna tora]|uniref:Cell division cycle-associated 7-like protein n=1 Tax=Senna tora TaxID=362788 RepID=A0A834X9D0_9FABA|nr:cell division cycle-associated 7-like protein [Senna tora]
MGRRRKNAGESDEEDSSDVSDDESPKRIRNEGPDFSRYEQIRDQRIMQNKERLQKLGILDLSQKLKSRTPPQQQKNPRPKKTTTTQPVSPRRSSRIKSLEPVKYYEVRKKNESSNSLEICIPEGTNPEVYTEEQEKLLGDCNISWELYVDGFDEDGNRIYDANKGQTCHQCRQKTLGLHTYCGKCELLQGQFCGDCLYTRYGENVLEANENRKWICPVCRGICNCSRCRKAKGWMPTGNLYRKVTELGFKSVAHYLIKTYRSETCSKSSVADEQQASATEETDSDEDAEM